MDGDGTMMEKTLWLFGYPIRCTVTTLDSGIHVLLTGGSRSHIGAVSIAQPGEAVDTKVFPGHKDQFISEPWAEKLSEATGQRVCVVCGIHYDDATKAQIAEILKETNRLLQALIQTLTSTNGTSA
jgi:hypothetical protein